ncbi:RHS repeat protein [Kutzneria buriramensis]|uniref:YD repeat-containing protein n=1 Tax=Kutzneria buriramensis TaxID=1045776 RepID=A0A3E0GW04_9PSEU|nr:YD repeat-containing protein [Kutzneria buriramensis]
MGGKTSQTDVDAGTTIYSYDNAGLLTSDTDVRGQTLAFSDDELGRKPSDYRDNPDLLVI